MRSPVMCAPAIKPQLRRHTLMMVAPGNYVYGTPAGSLHRAQAAQQVQALVAGLGGGVIGGALGFAVGQPLLGAVLGFGAFAGVVGAAARNRLGRLRSGAHGEQATAAALRHISDAAVFHDVRIGQENADHVVVTHQGIFVIETKNLAQCQVSRRGLWVRGSERQDIVRQARRQAGKLGAALYVKVTPVVVFVHPSSEVKTTEVYGVHVATLAGLSPLLAKLRRDASQPVPASKFNACLVRLYDMLS